MGRVNWHKEGLTEIKMSFRQIFWRILIFSSKLELKSRERIARWLVNYLGSKLSAKIKSTDDKKLKWDTRIVYLTLCNFNYGIRLCLINFVFLSFFDDFVTASTVNLREILVIACEYVANAVISMWKNIL